MKLAGRYVNLLQIVQIHPQPCPLAKGEEYMVWLTRGDPFIIKPHEFNMIQAELAMLTPPIEYR